MGSIAYNTETIQAYPGLYVISPNNSNGASIRLVSNDAVGSGTANMDVNFYDGPFPGTQSLVFRFLSAVGNSAGTRYNGLISADDRDGNHIPIRMFTNNASSAAKDGIYIEAGTNAGYVGFNNIVPTARLHAKSLATTEIMMKLQGIASQTGDYIELLDSTGGNIFIVNSTGGMYNKDSAILFDRQWTQSNGKFSTAGDAQVSRLVLRNSTTDATSTELFLDGNGGTGRIALAQNRTFTYFIHIIGRSSTGGSLLAGYEFGILTRATGGNVTLTANVHNNINTPAGWSTTISADTTNQSLKIAVVGAAATNIHWVAFIQIVEVV